MIHAYFGVDYEIVWNVATQQVPSLKQQIEQILATDDETP
ncbi:MAG TPA: HepT-like ribonuclease domain-containing protein [Longimicrobium sp.]|nr:HepT-like ribonuclease domain-containing protein [Longimicrobium sp.]